MSPAESAKIRQIKIHSIPDISRPHYTKLIACLNNRRLPESGRSHQKLSSMDIGYGIN